VTSHPRICWVHRCDMPKSQTLLQPNSTRLSLTMIAALVGLCATEGLASAEPPAEASRAARLVQEQARDEPGRQFAQSALGRFNVAEISGPADTPIPVRFELPDIQDGVYNFVVLQNLPEDFEISAGFAVEDRWVVPLDNLRDLTISAPKGYAGSFQLQVKLRIGGTDKSETRKVRVTISEPEGVNTAATATNAGSSSSSAGLSPEMEASMMDRAQALLDTRDIAGARMLYRFLIRKGSRKGAFGLAQTYDPAFLERIGVAGMDAADIDEAKKWYQDAAKRGHEEAQERLKLLAAGIQ